MALTTPFLEGQEALENLVSRYVDVDTLPWKPTPTPGIDMKILLQDKETGLLTALFRWAPVQCCRIEPMERGECLHEIAEHARHIGL